MITQLEEFAEENSVSAAGVKNVTKTLVAIPTSEYKMQNLKIFHKIITKKES